MNEENIEITPVENEPSENVAPEDIEIKPVGEAFPQTPPATPPEAPYAAKSGGSASVTLRLLTQEEFDRLQREKEMKEMGFKPQE